MNRVNGGVLSTWVLVAAIVLYLAVDGGGYDIVVRSQLGIVIWWVVLLGAAWGILPAARLTRVAWGALALLAGFVAWTALATTWSLSSERSLDELSRVACYLGILFLAIAMHRDRETALRHTIGALGASIVIVGCLALASRFRPDLFPGSQTTASFLPGASGRLGWPLNYWNALAAFVAFGSPLLLAIASSAKRLATQAAAAAGIPILVLCGYLTFSRGGAIAIAVALIAFLALAPERIPKLATALVAAAGSAVLIAGAIHRHAIDRGLNDAATRHQASSLLITLILVCVGVALAQVGIGLAVRHGTPPRVLTVSRQRARVMLGVATLAFVVVALLAGAPRIASHAWRDFKRPISAAANRAAPSRFGSTSGNDRYQYWKVAVNGTAGGHLLDGNGPGTFQLIWLPRGLPGGYVQNAHSLYFETLSDVGLVGLALLVAFLATVVGAGIRLVARSRYEARTFAAGATAALIAFCVSAAFDWIWQVPVLPAAFLLLAGAVLAPAASTARLSARSRRVVRGGAIVVAVACLAGISVPLAATNALRSSQAASARGNQTVALSDALAATQLETAAATPELQAALVLELKGQPQAALSAARRAAIDEPDNWTTWLIISRLEAEAGHPRAALKAFSHAKALNPRSPVFRQ